jgi:hypothetical protein
MQSNSSTAQSYAYLQTLAEALNRALFQELKSPLRLLALPVLQALVKAAGCS